MLLLLVPTETARDQGRKGRFSFSTSFCREQQRFTNEMYPGHLYGGIPGPKGLIRTSTVILGNVYGMLLFPGSLCNALIGFPGKHAPQGSDEGMQAMTKRKVC
jgi:hypothetical protein